MESNKEQIINRIEKVKRLAKHREVDAVLICKPENKFYYSEFHSTSYYILLTKDKNYLLTDSRYFEAAKEKASLFEVVLLDHNHGIFEFLSAFDHYKIGIEECYITLDFYTSMLKHLKQQNMYHCHELIEESRIIKDGFELEMIETAAKIADCAFSRILDFIRPGVSEKEIAFELEMSMRNDGAQGLSFETIVASGKRSSLPHGTFTEKRVEYGDILTLDFGCKYEGYCSDMTRTIGVGSISKEQKKVYDVVKQAQEEALGHIRGNEKCKDIDAIARNMISKHGYGDYFGHGLGHGVGLEIHERNTLNSKSEDVLRENTVVTVEPGIYLPGVFGVRIEDLVIVEKSGIKNLTSSKKELIIV